MEAFGEWLKPELEELEIDSDIYFEYITNILKDIDVSLEDKESSLLELLGDLTENDLSDLIKEIITKSEMLKDNSDISLKEKKRKELEESEAKLEAKLSAVKKEAEEVKNQPKLSTVERLEREKFVTHFGVQQMDIANDGTIILHEFDEDNGPIIPENDNKQKVKEEELSKRLKAKEEHEKEMAKIKAQKLAEKEKKEKEKKRTAKKERQPRG